MMQMKNKKRRLTTKSESSTPKGVVRKLLKSRRPDKPKSRSSKKTVDECKDEDTETTARQDAGTPVIGQDSKTRTPVGIVSSATKLKLAAFSASDNVVCCCYVVFPLPA